jgi:mono/diheme cytochrome c family protein
MKQIFSVACLAAALLTIGLTGCERSSYSDWVKYKFREDPILMASAKDVFGEDSYTPDRPGQLPLMRLDDLYKSNEHLLFPRVEKYQNPKQELLRDPTLIPADIRKEMDEQLTKLFGTPAHPKVAVPEGMDASVITKLKLDDTTLEQGSGLYREHCLHCHGVTGDGRGPTSRWVNPHPRDYRQMVFKFQSVDQATSGTIMPPSRDDLLRTLRNGIEGSSMPSFNLLSQEKLDALTSYVIHLSLRGKSEYDAIKNGFSRDNTGTLVSAKDDSNPGPVGYIAAVLPLNLQSWIDAQDPAKAIKVAPYPYKDGDKDALKASVRRGWKLFLGDEADPEVGKVAKSFNCVSCHTDYGRQAQFRWDEWGTMVRPNNLTNGIFRGGRRPVDIYYRIHSGINGSGMTNFGKMDNRHVWDLVNFVQNLSYPTMRKELDLKIN